MDTLKECLTGGIWFRRVGLHVMPCLVRPEFVDSPGICASDVDILRSAD